MIAPLFLELRALEPRVPVGAGIVLEISHRVSKELEMETVELNRDRTRIRVESLGDDGRAFELSGTDHIRERRLHPLAGVGRLFVAPPGAEWTSQLNLLDYASPFAAGSYRFSLVYRYGDAEGDTVATNEVSIEVYPAPAADPSWRWFTSASPGDEFCMVSSVEDGDRTRWLLQNASTRTLALPEYAIAIEVPDSSAHGVPLIAQLNDPSGLHAGVRLVAAEDGDLCLYRADLTGLVGPALRVSTELRRDEPMLLANPPLHRKDESVCGVAIGTPDEGKSGGKSTGKRAASVVLFTGAGARTLPVLTLPRPAGDIAVATWSGDDSLSGSWLWYVSDDGTEIVRVELEGGAEAITRVDGRVLAMNEQQSMGEGRVQALVHTRLVLRVLEWNLTSPQAEPVEVALHDLLEPGIEPPFLPGTRVAPYYESAAILARTAGGSYLLLPGSTSQLPEDQHGARIAGLVSSPRSLHLLRHSATHGWTWISLDGILKR